MLKDDNVNISDTITEFENKILECSECAKKLQTYKSNIGKSTKSCKNWFDQECRDMKSRVTAYLRKFRLIKSVFYLNNYLTQKKSYKRSCAIKKRKHNELTLQRLTDATSKPKEFWKVLRGISQSKVESSPAITSEKWLTHFEQLFNPSIITEETSNYNNQESNTGSEYLNSDIESYVLNMDISEEEIFNAIKSLKVDKAATGLLTAKHFKHSSNFIISYLKAILNKIYSSGEFPEQWALSILIPLYKKGPRDIPDNYRGISLIDIFSKIYIYILNKRLTFYCELSDKISESQAGFRPNYSTIDNVYVLNALVSKYICKDKGKLYVAFVDFRKAFDFVDRSN